MRYSQLLVAVNLQHDVRHLLQRSAKLAQRLGATLHILSVLPLDESLSDYAGSSALQRLKQESFSFLNELAASLPCDIGHCLIETGDVPDVLREALQRQPCDVLILGRRQADHALWARLRTSLAETLLPALPVDLLVLDEDKPFWTAPLQFTVAIELQERDHYLLKRASQLARQLDAELSVLHVMDPLQTARISADLELDSDAWMDRLVEQAERQLADWITSLAYPPQTLANTKRLNQLDTKTAPRWWSDAFAVSGRRGNR